MKRFPYYGMHFRVIRGAGLGSLWRIVSDECTDVFNKPFFLADQIHDAKRRGKHRKNVVWHRSALAARTEKQ